MTKSRKFVLCLAAVGACTLFNAGAAFATQSTSTNFNSGGQTSTQDNCVARFSSQLIHNGSAVRFQDRQSEMKDRLQLCAND
jgi:hypothetical protein